MARSSTTIATNREKSLVTYKIDMPATADIDLEFDNKLKSICNKLSTLIKVHKKRTVGAGCLAKELKEVYLDGLIAINGGTPRRNYGDCKCTHPPSFGHCVFGACVSVFKYGLKITINI
jgi:hypothetical protein